MENKKGGDLICKRPDMIIEARFKLTKKQNDVLDMVFASIEDDNKLKYEIDIAQYAQLYNVQDKSNIYGDIKKTVRTFEGKGFAITQKISEKKENRIYFSWFSSIQYLDGEGKIIVELGQSLKEIMLNAKKACFYQIKYPLNFRNIYSKRIYYYLKSFENTGWRIDNLDILRNKLECPISYNKFADFRKYVLTPAYDEINNSSDISFEYEIIKTKTKVTAIKFYIKTNKPKTSNKPLLLPDNEVCATTEYKNTNEEEKCSTELISVVKSIFKEDINGLQAKSLLDTANGDINIIKEKYKYSETVPKIDNIVGWVINAIKKDYQPPKGKVKKDNFTNYEQRVYDFDELEKKLLGWEK